MAEKQMRSSIIRVLYLTMLLCLLLSLSSCTLYESISDETGITYGYSYLKNDCFVGPISYSGDETTEIIIPEKFNGADVVQLGGYTGTGFPTPFLIYCDELYFSGQHDIYNTDDEHLRSLIDENTNVTVENVMFKIKLPTGLKRIYNTELRNVQYSEKIDGEIRKIKIFRPVYYFEISEENDTFYTKDGKLYYKETDELFSDCIYEKSDHAYS